MKHKLNTKDFLYIILVVILILSGIGMVVYAGIMQAILSYEKFGVIITEHIFIPHWSAWFYLGIIPASVGLVLCQIR